MIKYYYTYITILANHKMYVGKRTTKVNPLLDDYFGSPSKKCKEWQPVYKLFTQFTSEPIINSFNEYALHSWLNVSKNKRFYNKAKQTSVKFDTTGIKHTPEQTAKIRIANTGKRRTLEQRARMSKPKTAEARAILSAANRGNRQTTETRAKISAKLMNKTIHLLANTEQNLVFSGTAYSFRTLFNLTPTKVSRVLSGKIKSTQGWRVLLINELSESV